MSETTERDRGLLSLIDRLMKRPETPAIISTPVASIDEPRDGLDAPLPEIGPAASLEPQIAVETTRRVDPEELAALIVKALQAGDGYPKRGFEITVYGRHPWNAMLRITPAAGPVDAKAWRTRLETIVMLFREQYEIADGTGT